MTTTPTLASVFSAALDVRLEGVRTAMPAQVESYDSVKQCVSVQPLIQASYIDETGARQVETLPVINDVPVVFPGAGGFRVTFPITRGDTVLLVFSQFSLDKFLVKGGITDPVDDRRHTLSDAIALPGLRTFSNALNPTDTEAMTAGHDSGAQIQFYEDEIHVGGNSILMKRSEFLNHAHTSFGGPPVEIAPTIPVPFPGTTVLRG